MQPFSGSCSRSKSWSPAAGFCFLGPPFFNMNTAVSGEGAPDVFRQSSVKDSSRANQAEGERSTLIFFGGRVRKKESERKSVSWTTKRIAKSTSSLSKCQLSLSCCYHQQHRLFTNQGPMQSAGRAQWKAALVSVEVVTLSDADLCSASQGNLSIMTSVITDEHRGDGGQFWFWFWIGDHHFPSSLFWKVSDWTNKIVMLLKRGWRIVPCFPGTNKQHLFWIPLGAHLISVIMS